MALIGAKPATARTSCPSRSYRGSADDAGRSRPSRRSGDAHGGRFHLLVGDDDWRTCLEPDPAWPQRRVLAPTTAARRGRFEWRRRDRLAAPGPPRSRSPGIHRQRLPRTPEERRGADRDRYGTWYWITPGRAGHRPPRARAREAAAVVVARRPGHHVTARRRRRLRAPVGPPVAASTATPGRARHHHRPPARRRPRGRAAAGCCCSTCTPRVRRWCCAGRRNRSITPFDLAATASGGASWCSTGCGVPGGGSTADGGSAPTSPRSRGHLPACGRQRASTPRTTRDRAAPESPARPAARTRSIDPVAIAEHADGRCLLLDRPAAGPSAVVLADSAAAGGVLARLRSAVEALDPTRPDLPTFVHDVVGQDLCAGGAADAAPLPGPLRVCGRRVHRRSLRRSPCSWAPGPAARLVHQSGRAADAGVGRQRHRRWRRGRVLRRGRPVGPAWSRSASATWCAAPHCAPDAAFAERAVVGQPFDSGIARLRVASPAARRRCAQRLRDHRRRPRRRRPGAARSAAVRAATPALPAERGQRAAVARPVGGGAASRRGGGNVGAAVPTDRRPVFASWRSR